MAFEFNIMDMHQLVNELWPTREEAYELQFWIFKFKHVCFSICICAYILIQGPHPPRDPTLENKIFNSYPNSINSPLQLLDFLKICSNDDFFVPTPSLWNRILHGSGQSIFLNNNGLKCPRHQGWYGISKFTGMHPMLSYKPRTSIGSFSSSCPLI
jgi:hypothetical protein